MTDPDHTTIVDTVTRYKDGTVDVDPGPDIGAGTILDRAIDMATIGHRPDGAKLIYVRFEYAVDESDRTLDELRVEAVALLTRDLCPLARDVVHSCLRALDAADRLQMVLGDDDVEPSNLTDERLHRYGQTIGEPT